MNTKRKNKKKAMKTRIFILSALFCLLALSAHAQDTQRTDSIKRKPLTFEWNANAYTFFDNTEYQGCPYATSGTVSGIRLSPEFGIGWGDGKYRLMAGLHAQKDFGSKEFIDHLDFIAYFEYHQQHKRVAQHFIMGAFPRNGHLDNYSEFFIDNEFHYFRPNMTGLHYQIDGKVGFVNVWLDWTGLQSKTERETFFVGVSGEARAKAFVGGGEFYMFHYANTDPPSGDACVHDNILGHFWAGIDMHYWGWKHVNRLRLTAGLMAGVERKRDDITPTKAPLGLVLNLDANIWRFGINALYYYGEKRFTVETDDFDATYWGTKTLQSGNVLQAQIYYDLFKWDGIQGTLGYLFNVVDGKLYHEQLLQLRISLNRQTLKQLRNHPKY